MKIHLAPDLLNQFGRNVETLQLSLGQDRQHELDMHLLGLARGAMTIWFAALATTLDEGTGKHLAQASQGTDPPATRLEFGIAGHI